MVTAQQPPTHSAQEVRDAVQALANPERARLMQRYFKTGSGEYGEGDIFLGLPVPVARGIARTFTSLPADELDQLITSPVHEVRFIALVIHTVQYKRTKADTQIRNALFYQYDRWLAAGHINNWDLVDVSAPHIGAYLFTDETPSYAEHYLSELSQKRLLWQRRASVIFTFAALDLGNINPALSACRRLVFDEHDLIHKAVGWVVREVGKRDVEALRTFLSEYAATMPRTALRYAIEKFDSAERQHWLGMRLALNQLK